MKHRATVQHRNLIWIGVLLIAAVLCPTRGATVSLTSARLLIAGSRLTVAPESQTVPYNTPTIVNTNLEGFDAGLGELPADLRVLADFTGPEIGGIMTLETVPNEPFRIPSLTLEGEYVLDNIRLIQGDELLGYAEPRSAAVLVTQILITKVTSRALTLDEIRSHGIVIDNDNFQAYNFTFGFAVDGEVYDYNVPVIWRPEGDPEGRGTLAVLNGGGSARFAPPRLSPFVLEHVPDPEAPKPSGCFDGCFSEPPPPLPGAIVFPTEFGLLNQFFSVILMVQNGAPEGDPLVVRDLTAKITVPAGLREAETEPPTPLGVPVPVRVPGPDGQLGTADDVTFLIAQATGEAQWLVEGLREGTHIVDISLEGVVDGLPSGIQRVAGKARGAVVVRDPTFGITVSHPNVVRRDEEYPLRLTVSNTSNAPANLVTVKLPASKLIGTELVDPNDYQRTIDTLLPGDSEILEFRMRSLLTGRVTAAGARNPANIHPTFEMTVGVGENDIPLSPTSIVLPRSTESLPQELVRRALNLIGLGFSLATAPPELLAPEHPRVSRRSVDTRVFELAQAGRVHTLGEDLFDTAAVLAAEWNGARNADWNWDVLRRTTVKGKLVGESLAEIFAAEAATNGAETAFERFVATTAFLPPMGGALAVGDGAHLELVSRTSGKILRGAVGEAAAIHNLPFADLYPLGGAEMAMLAVPEEGGYRIKLSNEFGGSSELQVLITAPGPELRLLRWTGVPLSSSGKAVVEVNLYDLAPMLVVDEDGDGIVDQQIAPTVDAITPRPFQAIAAVQNADEPSGHVIEVLFTGDVDAAYLSPPERDRFKIPNKISNGGGWDVPGLTTLAVAEGEPSRDEPFAGLRNERVIQVVFNNPISPYIEQEITVDDVASVLGEVVSNQVLPVITTVTTPGTMVEGRVIGPDGEPLPYVEVSLTELDLDPYGLSEIPCVAHKTAAVRTDAQGRFFFDYVRDTECGGLFTLSAEDPVSEQAGAVSGRVRFEGEIVSLDIVLLGRGSIRGHIVYDDGAVPNPREVSLIAFNPAFREGRRAVIDDYGNYEVGDLPVGTVNLAVKDSQGNFAHSTAVIPVAGSVVERDLTIFRRPAQDQGELRGVVYEADGATPANRAWLALYSNRRLVSVLLSNELGQFDFGSVPAGPAEIEAFDGRSGLSGAKVFFEIGADRVNEVEILLRNATGTVEGHVYQRTAAGLEPVAGAIVYAAWTPFNTTTDAAGFFRLEGVYAGNVTIAAFYPVTGQEARKNTTVPENGVGQAELILPGEAQASGIAGQVLDYDGQPLGGVAVRMGGEGATWFIHTYYTEPDGSFFIPDVSVGSHGLHAVSGGDGAWAGATVRYPGDTPYVTMQFKRGTIRGTVKARTGPGDPVGVQSVVRYRTTTVRYGLVGMDSTSHDLETAADGTFEIPDVLAGPFVLTVYNAFHGEQFVEGEIFQNGEIVEREIVLEASGIVRGQVLTHDGVTPAVGARVDLYHPNVEMFIDTDAEGRFEFPLVPPHEEKPFRLEVFFEDGAAFRWARALGWLTRGGQVVEIDLTLPEQGAVSGVVEDSTGQPVPLADVVLRETHYPYQELSLQSDDQGTFSFHNVFVGTSRITARAPTLGGLGGSATVEVEWEGQQVDGVVVRLQDTGEITGTVLSPVDGSAVPSVQLQLHGRGGLYDAVTSDAEGNFRFSLLPLGSYRITALDLASGRQGERYASVQSNGEIVAVDLVLETRGEVAGHLYQPQSTTPVPGATVKLTAGDASYITSYASTDGDGFFEFLGVPQGTFRLAANEPNGRRKADGSGEVTGEGERVLVDIYLQETGSVVGSVFAPIGAHEGLFDPVNVQAVQVLSTVGGSLDNPFRIDGLIVGVPVKLNVEEVGGPHRGIAEGIIGSHGQEVTIDVRMEPIGAVEVSVLDAQGVPVTGVDVQLRSNGFYGGFYAGSTGAGHQLTFQGIGSGQFSVAVYDPVLGLGGSAAGTVVSEGELVSVTAVLEATGTVRGRVLLDDGLTPATGAPAVLSLPDRHLYAEADADGRFEHLSVPLRNFVLDLQERQGPGKLQRTGAVTVANEVVDLGDLVLDDFDPLVLATDPATGAIGVDGAAAVTVYFSEPVVATSANAVSLYLGSGTSSVPLTKTWQDGGATLLLTPSEPLASFSDYRILVRGAGSALNEVRDFAGRVMSDPVQATFTTRDYLPPTVIETTPPAGAVNVPVDGQLRVIFSEPVEAATLSGSSIQLSNIDTGAGITTTFTVQPSATEVLITPVGELEAESRYSLTLTGIEDDVGNVMPLFVLTFETFDATPPSVQIVAPAGPLTEGVEYSLNATAVASPDLASVSFYANDRLLGTDGDVPYTATYTPSSADAAAGSVSLTAAGTDRAGNVGAADSVTRAVTADLPPEVTFTVTPADSALAGTTFQVSGEAQDGSGLTEVLILISGDVERTDRYTPPGSTTATFGNSYTLPAVPVAGTVEVRVRATDRLGKATETAPHLLAVAADTEAPVIADVAPPAGAVATAGTEINFGIIAADNVAVAQVAFTFNGETFVDTQAPYEWTVTAPEVSTPTAYPVEATAEDLAGNQTVESWEITVEPLINPDVPTVEILCPANGDPYLPGVDLSFDFALADDQLLQAYRIYVDGVLEQETTPIDQLELSSNWIWTPPAAAAAGNSAVIRIEADDYAGNTGIAEVTLTVPAGTVLAAGQALDASFSGQNLVLANGEFTVTENLSLADLVLHQGAVLRPAVATPASLWLEVTGALHAACGATVDASGRGYLGGTLSSPTGGAPSWVAGSEPNSGGSHGGAGVVGSDAGPAGEVYGSVYVPGLAGGGGSHREGVHAANYGRPGGGVIELSVGELVLEGEIRSQGETTTYYAHPAGAGGSVLVTAGVLRGGGLIDTSGGRVVYCHSTSSPGGGGRVSLDVDSLVGFDPSLQVRAWGGDNNCAVGHGSLRVAAPGTVYVYESGDTYGDLLVDAGEFGDGTDRKGLVTELPALGADAVAATEVSGSDLWVTGGAPFVERWLGAWMVLVDGAGADLGGFQVVEVDGSGRVLLAGAGGVTTAADYRGEYRFDNVRLANGGGVSGSDPLVVEVAEFSGSAALHGEVRAQTAIVRSGAEVRPTGSDPLRMTVTGTLTIESGGVLDATGQGYVGGTLSSLTGGAPSWVLGSEPNSGGSHGGAGVVGSDSGPAGEVYGSVYVPGLAGGGGSHRDGVYASNYGRAGGGVIELSVGELVLEGEIRSQGETTTYYAHPAGAGGSVLVTAGVLRGGGLIDTSGGRVVYCHSTSSPGGGGRVSLDVDSLVGFDPSLQVRAWGGDNNCAVGHGSLRVAAPGTVYVYESGDTYGDLLVDAGEFGDGTDRKGLVTELPALGADAVAATEVSGSDLWVTGGAPFVERWLGAWMVLVDGAGADLGGFQVVEVDGSGRVLLAGAGGVTTAADYRGEYRFDNVRLANGGGLFATDGVRAAALAVEDGDSVLPETFTATDLTVRAGAVARPGVSGLVKIDVPGVLTIESGGVLDATGQGYVGGTLSSLTGGAPSWVLGSEPNSGGSHGGAGVVGSDSGPAGEVYGSVYVPGLAGGGGSHRDGVYASNYGRAGGGVIELSVGELVLEGEIRSQGETTTYYAHPAGAGGSVLVTAGVLRGGGLIDTSGGRVVYCHSTSSPGGGGRVSLDVDSLVGFDPSLQVRAWGGDNNCAVGHGSLRVAAPGTVYVYESGDTYGDLLVDAGEFGDGTDRKGLVTELPALGADAVAATEVSGSDLWVTGGAPFVERWLGAWMVLVDGAGADLGGFQVVEVDGSGRVLLAGAGGVTTAADYRGEYRFDNLEMRNSASLATEDGLAAGDTIVFAGDSGLPAEFTSQNFTLHSDAVARLADASHLILNVPGVLTIESGGVLDATGQGYVGGTLSSLTGGAPSWVAGSEPNSGGSHGGAGVVGSDEGPAGEVYGSVYVPGLAGGGGSHRDGVYASNYGRAGGGVIELSVGELVLEGEIRSQGETTTYYAHPAGAGGSVLVTAGVLRGGGLIDTSGGRVVYCHSTSSPGGGGRVSLDVDSLVGFDPSLQVRAWGGDNNCAVGHGSLRVAAPGTVYVYESGDTYGDLYILNSEPGKPPLTTVLPRLGVGTVATVTADGTDPAAGWLLPVEPVAGEPHLFALGVQGMWTRINGIDYAVLDQRPERTEVLLDGAAGVVQPGDGFQGVYKFDRVVVRSGAVLEFPDTAEVGVYDMDADSGVNTP